MTRNKKSPSTSGLTGISFLVFGCIELTRIGPWQTYPKSLGDFLSLQLHVHLLFELGVPHFHPAVNSLFLGGRFVGPLDVLLLVAIFVVVLVLFGR